VVLPARVEAIIKIEQPPVEASGRVKKNSLSGILSGCPGIGIALLKELDF
jgi:hypothetical protein